jgi:cell division protein ZapA
MPDVMIKIGDREFSVSCQEGEEHFLQAAAGLLDAEATALNAQIGRLPEARMLLMAGLMLADKAAGADDQVKALKDQIATLEGQVAALQNAPAPEPQRIEVPVVPDGLTESLSELAARSEALAQLVEEKASA